MEFKLAREDLESEPIVITIEEIEERASSEGEAIVYFDRSNSQKALNQLVKHFDKKFERSVYVREVRYGLDENDYLYEVHIL
jgi:ABC-type Zn uptake system ZnuABC Zn-binding protein ZnuA